MGSGRDAGRGWVMQLGGEEMEAEEEMEDEMEVVESGGGARAGMGVGRW